MAEEKQSYTPTDMSFEDDNFHGGSDEFSFRKILLDQFSRTRLEGSKEMVSGGIYKRVIGGQVYEFPQPNQREIFINHCRLFRSIFLSKCKENPKYKDKIKEMLERIDKRLSDLSAKCNKLKEKVQKPNANDPSFKHNSSEWRRWYIENIKDIDDYKENEQVEIYKELFEEILFYCDKINLFDSD